jgi:pimeloyl-ACP methyl ester carboxylesterase
MVPRDDASGSTTTTTTAEASAMSGELTERTFQGPDGTTFAYVDAGSGSPILLLHGWSSSWRWFERNIPALSRNHRVLALDFRGHGSSEKTESGHTMDQYARDVHDFVAGMGLDGVLMAGWSMGSIVLWSYVLQFGRGQASGMVFVGQSASDLITPEYEHGIMTMDDLADWIHTLQSDREPMVRENMRLMVGREPTPAEHDWMTADYLRCPAHIATVALYSQTVTDVSAAFAQIDFPTQVHFGVDPKMYKLDHGEYLASRIRGAELVVFEQSGHVPMWEEPERFVAEIERFAATLGG